MSIDERLRAGLAADTAHLGSDLDLVMSSVVRRVHRRRQVRAVGAALLTAAVVVAFAWLGGLPGVDRSSRQQDPVDDPDVTVNEARPLAGVDGPIDPGTWVMSLWGREGTVPEAVVEVPAGYGTPGGGVVYRQRDPSDTGEVSFWTASEVYDDACQGNAPVAVGPSVDDLADALLAQNGHRTTRPEPVRLDGHDGVYLELTWPGLAGVIGCHESELFLWRTGESVYHWGVPGTVLRLWILDVEGTRVVVTASATPDDDPTEIAELVSIATSAHFTYPVTD